MRSNGTKQAKTEKKAIQKQTLKEMDVHAANLLVDAVLLSEDLHGGLNDPTAAKRLMARIANPKY
jgi:hypothetical protein